MRRLSPRLATLLPRSQMQQLHRRALQILGEIGIELSDSALRQRFAGREGVALRGDRVCLSPALVEGYLEEQRAYLAAVPKVSAERLTLAAYDYASYIVDLGTDAIRPITESDLVDMTRLIDALAEAGYPVSGACPGFAQDLPEALRPLAQFRIGAQNSRFGGCADLPTVWAAEYVWRMSRVMGQGLGLGLFMFSPLRVDEASLAVIVHFLDQGADLSLGVSAMPLLGATTPLALGDALAQSIAEILGGFSLLKMLAGSRPVDLRVNLFAFDMKHANVALGSAEEALLAVIAREVNTFYRGVATEPRPYIFSMGIVPGAQTAAEKSATAMLKALVGSQTLSCGGATASTVFSPEQLVIDCEIVAYVNRVRQGFDLSAADAGLDLFREGVASGTYLDRESTALHYRESYWQPQFFEHVTYQQWCARHRPDLRERAVTTVRDMIARHSFRLDPDRARQLDAIYAEAKGQVGKGVEG